MKVIASVFFLIFAALVLSSLFVVPEGSKGIVIEFGKVKLNSEGETQIFEPGLHAKLPLIASVKLLDSRIQTLDGAPDRFVTSEKKDLIIDSYVKWKIKDFAKYFLATGGDNFRAEVLLGQKINDGLRSEIGKRTIKDIVSGERGEVMDAALTNLEHSSELGISVVDVRIKQINLPQEVSKSIYQRMRAERNAVAKEHRSMGHEKAAIIKATIDAKVTVMVAKAEQDAKIVRGEGDAKAAAIYADAYNKSPEFFNFWRSLTAYRNSFDSKGDLLVIEPDSDFFKYMKSNKAK